MRAAAACLLPWIAVSAVAAASQATVELLPEAKVSSEQVVLGQVARISTTDLALMRKLVHLRVGPAPRHGSVSVLQRSAATVWLHREMGVASELVAWRGADEAKVVRVASELRGEEIARAALEAATREWWASGRTPQLNPRLLPHDVAVPEGELRLVVRGIEQAGWQRRAVLWVDVWAGAAFVRTVPVAIAVGGPDTQSPGDGLGPPTVLAESQATASVDSDPQHLAVTRGEWAVLRSVQGSIALESRVEVLQDGRPGQKVKVRQQGATGLLLARVLAPGELELAP